MQGPLIKAFVTFFPECQNLHLIKDVGMIPYVLHRDFAYDSSIMCYKGDFPYLDYVPGLSLIFLNGRRPRRLSAIKASDDRLGGYIINRVVDKIQVLLTAMNSLPALLKHGKKIDVLQLYHFKYESLVIGFIYRLWNPGGVLYLKLDMSTADVQFYRKSAVRMKNTFYPSYLLFRLASFDLITVESREVYEFLANEHPLYKRFRHLLHYLPNGVDFKSIPRGSAAKENVILHVARLGAYEKGSEIILEAFSGVSREFPDWKLILIGAMSDDFKKRFDEYLDKNADIKGRVIHVNFIKDRDEFYGYYQKARILAMPSRSESFGLVGIEGGSYGDVILGTDIPSIRDMTNNGQCGYLCPVDDTACFEKTLRHMLSHEKELYEASMSMSKYIQNAYDITRVCRMLDDLLQQCMLKRHG